VGRVLQLVPYLPPRISGVGDFATVLARTLRERHDIATTFLVANSEAAARPAGEARVIEITDRKPAALARIILDEKASGLPLTLLLHYSGYGYQTRGVPIWLRDVLREAKRLDPQTRLLTYFHELFAFGMPWQSSFWLSPVQSHIARELLALSDVALTNSTIAQTWLRDRAPATKPVHFLPVFSNVGEPVTVAATSERSLAAVAWGSPEQKARIYSTADSLVRVLGAQKIGVLYDVGAPVQIPSRVRDAVDVREMGVLPGHEISGLLSHLRFGLMSYRPALVTKSGIHAAFCAHGAAPVSTWTGNERTPEGVPMWTLANLPGDDASGICRTWYAGHSADVLSDQLVALLT